MPRAEVLYYALCHDHGEFTAGDTPYSAKELAPGLREGINFAEEIGRNRLGVTLPEISQEEFLKFKVCDLLEMFETGVVEWRMGNRYCGVVVVDCANAALNFADRLDTGSQNQPNYLHVTNWIHANGYKGAHHYDVL